MRKVTDHPKALAEKNNVEMKVKISRIGNVGNPMTQTYHVWGWVLPPNGDDLGWVYENGLTTL